MVEARENFHQGIEIIERQALFAHLYKFLDKRRLVLRRVGQHDLSCYPIAHLHNSVSIWTVTCVFCFFVPCWTGWSYSKCWVLVRVCWPILGPPVLRTWWLWIAAIPRRWVVLQSVAQKRQLASQVAEWQLPSLRRKCRRISKKRRGKKGTSIQSHNAQVEGYGYGIQFREAGNPNGFGRFGVDCVLDAAKLLEMPLELCDISLGVSTFLHHFPQLVACSLRKHRLEGGNPFPQKLQLPVRKN